MSNNTLHYTTTHHSKRCPSCLFLWIKFETPNLRTLRTSKSALQFQFTKNAAKALFTLFNKPVLVKPQNIQVVHMEQLNCSCECNSTTQQIKVLTNVQNVSSHTFFSPNFVGAQTQTTTDKFGNKYMCTSDYDPFSDR